MVSLNLKINRKKIILFTFNIILLFLLFSFKLNITKAVVVVPISEPTLPFIGTNQLSAPSGNELLTKYLVIIYNTFIGLTISISVIRASMAFVNNKISALQGKGVDWKPVQASAAAIGLSMFAYIGVRFINPDLVRFDILTLTPNAERPVSPEPTDPVPPDPAGSELSEQEARANLSAHGILVNNSTPCPYGMTFQTFETQNPGQHCTTTSGLTNTTIENLATFGRDCERYFVQSNTGSSGAGCQPIVLTGGTELGHQFHGPGIQVVDIRSNPDIDRWVRSTASRIWVSGNQACHGSVYFYREYSPDHWHISMYGGGICP